MFQKESLCLIRFITVIFSIYKLRSPAGWSVRRGGLVVNTLAYHTGDPGSIPGRAVCRKSVRVSEVIFHLPPATLQA